MSYRSEHSAERPSGVDAATSQLLSAMSVPPRLHQLGPVDGRIALDEMQGATTAVDGVVESFHTLALGPSGLLGFRVFRPTHDVTEIPAVMYVHGGRWVFGDGDTHSRLTQTIARDAGVALFVPEYSRAPEARYPVALEECIALLRSMYNSAREWNIDASRLGIAGDCAGATLATVVAQCCPELLGAQVLFYPLTDAMRSSASHESIHTNNSVLESDDLGWSWDCYTDVAATGCEPTVSPIYASRVTLAALPPTLIVSADADPVRDETRLYANRLREAGVSVTAVRYLGTVHDFVSLTALRHTAQTGAALEQACSFLRSQLHAALP
ncbi:alpha/beta hydrolase [Rhodococcoides yunnanense]|uniref:alpha/beta hydrolase n=1 Tax=Rhodococcoides yunnanense TaxID=278209 RepID=UPI001FE728F6|nr:alpha/beta hydrolase [Rhodococcus yunnanensis]